MTAKTEATHLSMKRDLDFLQTQISTSPKTRTDPYAIPSFEGSALFSLIGSKHGEAKRLYRKDPHALGRF